MLNIIYLHLLNFLTEIIGLKKLRSVLEYEVQSCLSIFCHHHSQLLLKCIPTLVMQGCLSFSFEWYMQRFPKLFGKVLLDSSVFYIKLRILYKAQSYRNNSKVYNLTELGLQNYLSQLSTQLVKSLSLFHTFSNMHLYICGSVSCPHKDKQQHLKYSRH